MGFYFSNVFHIFIVCYLISMSLSPILLSFLSIVGCFCGQSSLGPRELFCNCSGFYLSIKLGLFWLHS